MLNVTLRMIAAPLKKVAGEAGRQAKVQGSATVDDVFQSYGKVKKQELAEGGKLITGNPITGRLQLFKLRIKALGKLVSALTKKIPGSEKLASKLPGGNKMTAEQAGEKAGAQAHQAQTSAT